MTDEEVLENVARLAERETARSHLLNLAYATSTPGDDRVSALLNQWYAEDKAEYERDFVDRQPVSEPSPDGDAGVSQPVEEGGA